MRKATGEAAAGLLSSRPDPLGVLASTAGLVADPHFVELDLESVERAADRLAAPGVELPGWNREWHFGDGTGRTVHYVLLLDALNFSFWGPPAWTVEHAGRVLKGYWALSAGLKHAMEREPRLADAAYLETLSLTAWRDLLDGQGTIPLLEERWRIVRDIGAVLRRQWNGSAAALVAAAGGDAARLARMVAEAWPSFRDVAPIPGAGGARPEARFYKRAQILVSDLWNAGGGEKWGRFDNMEVLTAFADYRLPQILRAWDVLRYAPDLADRVDGEEALEPGSREELEIRAASIWAVEWLREALARRGRRLWSIQVDWILWAASHGDDTRLKPHHRTRTIWY